MLISQKDFLFKLTVAYKEARETRYWLRLLRDSGILRNSEILISDCEELLRISGSIQKTMKDKMGITGVAETAEFFYESENIKGI
ncbi:MAG: four helix bundle protein [Chitinispirillaceae bacterium]